MEIKRDKYIVEMLSKRHNGLIKVITGMRRVGKSYLLFHLFHDTLINEGVSENNIIQIALDKKGFESFRNPNVLYDYVIQHTTDSSQFFYVFIDEIQLSYKVKNTSLDESMVPEEDKDLLYTTFYDVLNDLREQPNLDIYVTGSNSKMLSSDIITNFRDRSSQISIYPLTFAEYFAISNLDKIDALQEYMMYGGMPLAVLDNDEASKRKYLKDLYKKVYLKDIVERYHLSDDISLGQMVDVLCSSVGSLTNPHNLSNVLLSTQKQSISDQTIKKYFDYLSDAFLFSKVNRYDVRGKHYLTTPVKYYSSDIGLRNARLNFRQQEEGHILENILYNELIQRGYSVDVGVVTHTKNVDGKNVQSQYEIDFVVNTFRGKVYIQCAANLSSSQVQEREIFSLKNTADFFRKIIVVGSNQKAWITDDGIEYIGIIPFLLEDVLV